MPQGLQIDIGEDDINELTDWAKGRLDRPIFTWSLHAEIIIWAIGAMKKDPTISIREAIESACREWDC